MIFKTNNNFFYRTCNFALEVVIINPAKKTYAISDGQIEGWRDESKDG